VAPAASFAFEGPARPRKIGINPRPKREAYGSSCESALAGNSGGIFYVGGMLFFAVAIAMGIGMLGIVAPFVPGLLLMWLAALAYGLIGEFEGFGAVAFGVITVLFLLGEAAGYVLPGRAAGAAGATGQSIALGAIAGIVGFFVIPVFGLPIGAVLGIFGAEFLRTKSGHEAYRTTVATIIGFGVGVLAQLGFGIAIVCTWLAWVVVV
jgi:uncharacterized protein YqgC (DUF456 family)